MKKLSLKDIKSGVLVGQPVPAIINIVVSGEDCQIDTFIKPFNYQTAVAAYKAYGENKEALAGIIASCLCDENGELQFTEDEVRQHFSQHLVDAVWTEIYKVNNIAGKSNLQTTNAKSGTSSSSTESVEKPLKKPSKPSATKSSSGGLPTEQSAEA